MSFSALAFSVMRGALGMHFLLLVSAEHAVSRALGLCGQRLAKSQQEVQLLHAMLRGWQSGRRLPSGEIAGAPNGMMAPNGGMEGTPGMGGMGAGGMGMGSNVGAPFKRADWHGGRHLLQGVAPDVAPYIHFCAHFRLHFTPSLSLSLSLFNSRSRFLMLILYSLILSRCLRRYRNKKTESNVEKG